MYFPYFRGKQYELLTVREMAKLISDSSFVPIIEPVKESFSGLVRTLEAIEENNGEVVLIINPNYGDHTNNSKAIEEMLTQRFQGANSISIGILLSEIHTIEGIKKIFKKYRNSNLTFIHSGFNDPQELSKYLNKASGEIRHVFFDKFGGKLYRKHFESKERILLRDGFKSRINRNYPNVELFSELHLTYKDEGMDGFGDFLIVGDAYSESGGPAYAVAIHITFVDAEDENQMYIFHFISDRQDTPTDPAGKFAEALKKLIAEVNKPSSKILETDAIKEFKDLHKRNHFPGLGYVKKLSMKHHLETLADFL